MALKQGLFICFEGVEGSGKSTQSKLLYQYIKKNISKKVILTREPGGTKLSEKIRNFILNDKNNLDVVTEFLLIMAGRNEHVTKKINYYLKKKYIVICDRFFFSTLAYQHYLEKMNINFIYAIQKIIYPKLYPDITFLLDLNRLTSKIRINKRNKKRNKFDQLSNKKFNIIRKGFLKISKKYNKKIIKINSNQNISFIKKAVLNKTIEHINARS